MGGIRMGGGLGEAPRVALSAAAASFDSVLSWWMGI